MSHPRRWLAAVGVAIVVAALMTACGGGDRAQEQPRSAASAPPQSSSPANPAVAPGQTTPAAGTAPPSVPAVRWSACRGGAGPKGYQSAVVQVPRDPAHPGDATIPMAIDRHPATGHKIGSLLVNPGGPGVSGVDYLSTVVPELPKDVRAAFDVVGFDPPGVGRTAPITCLDSAALARYFHTDPAPPTQAGFDALVTEARTLAAGCAARSGTELPYVSTTDAARDMDVLRAALGDSRLTYLGFSYGTLLGATYAGLFPTHVRAMVLDGALDPAEPPITAADQQAAALDGELQQFFATCARAPKCPWTPGGNLATAFQALLQQVRANPLTAQHTSRTVGPAELLYGTAAALYSTTTWNDLAVSLRAASQGDGTDLLEFFDLYTGRGADGSYSNVFEANPAVDCLQAPRPSLAALTAALPAAEAAAPVFGQLIIDGLVTSAVWPVPATGSLAPIRAAGSPPIVVVGSTGDPITPYRSAQALAGELAHGVLLTRVGDGHTAYRASSCIRTWVDRYLITLATPPPNTRCSSQ